MPYTVINFQGEKVVCATVKELNDAIELDRRNKVASNSRRRKAFNDFIEKNRRNKLASAPSPKGGGSNA